LPEEELFMTLLYRKSITQDQG